MMADAFADLVEQARNAVLSRRAPRAAADAQPALVPLPRGRNNRVFRAVVDGQAVCVKIYRSDGLPRAEREWQALHLLAAHGLTAAPQPLAWAPGVPDVLVMEWVPGEPVPASDLSDAQLGMLREALGWLYQLTPVDAPHLLHPAHGSATVLVQDLDESRAALASAASGRPGGEAVHHLLDHWLRGEGPIGLAETVPSVFSRGDPNLENCLWDGAALRLVDFEYSGWTDRGWDLGDLWEHPNARGSPDARWSAFVDGFHLTDQERARLRWGRQAFGLFWLVRGWQSSGNGGPGGRWVSQLERTTHLLELP